MWWLAVACHPPDPVVVEDDACDDAVLDAEVPIPGVHSELVGPETRALVAGADAELVVFDEVSSSDGDVAADDTGSHGYTHRCWAQVLDPTGAPRGDRSEVPCDRTLAAPLGSGFYLTIGTGQWRVGSDGALTPLADAEFGYAAPYSNARAAVTAVERGAGIRVYGVVFGGGPTLETHDLGDDGSDTLVSAVPVSGVGFDFAIAHDGSAGVLAVGDEGSDQSRWVRLDEDGAFVGDLEPLPGVVGEPRALLVDAGVVRATFATPHYTPQGNVVDFVDGEPQIGPVFTLDPEDYGIFPRPGGEALLLYTWIGEVKQVALRGLKVGSSVTAIQYQQLGYVDAVVDGPGGPVAVGRSAGHELAASLPDGEATVVSDDVLSLDPPRFGYWSETGPLGTLVGWTERSRQGAAALLAPDGSVAAEGDPGFGAYTAPLVATDDAFWIASGSAVVAVGADLQATTLPLSSVPMSSGAQVGDRVLVPSIEGRLQVADLAGQLVDSEVDGYVSSIVADTTHELALIAEWDATFDNLTFRTVDADLQSSFRSDWSLRPVTTLPWTCGPGCWVLSESGDLTAVIRGDGVGAPTLTESTLLGPASLGVPTPCGLVMTRQDGLSVSAGPDEAPTTSIPGDGRTVFGLVPTADGALLLESGDGAFVRRLTFPSLR